MGLLKVGVNLADRQAEGVCVCVCGWLDAHSSVSVFFTKSLVTAVEVSTCSTIELQQCPPHSSRLNHVLNTCYTMGRTSILTPALHGCFAFHSIGFINM